MADQVTCSECGWKGRGVVPRGGDGSGMAPFRHRKPGRTIWCIGSRFLCVEDDFTTAPPQEPSNGQA